MWIPRRQCCRVGARPDSMVESLALRSRERCNKGCSLSHSFTPLHAAPRPAAEAAFTARRWQRRCQVRAPLQPTTRRCRFNQPAAVSLHT